MRITERIDRVLREQLGPGFDWTAETRLVEDLGLDSLDLVQLINNLEREFGIPIDDDWACENLETPGRIAREIEPLLAAKPALFAA